MKKIIYIISLFVSSVLYTSCDALDLAPEDYFGSGNYWNNKAQVEGFMNGMHSQLRGNYNMFYCLGELRGGTQRVGSSSQNTSLDYAILRTNTLSQDNPGFSNWFGLYSPIMQVNHFIQKVENECDFLSEADRKAYLGQAYGLRALYYFMLYKTYGGVPIVTTVELLDGRNVEQNNGPFEYLYDGYDKINWKQKHSQTITDFAMNYNISEEEIPCLFLYDLMQNRYKVIPVGKDTDIYAMIKAMVEEIAEYKKDRENIGEQLEKYRNIEQYYCLYEKLESEAEKGNSKQCVAIRRVLGEAQSYKEVKEDICDSEIKKDLKRIGQWKIQ